MTITFNFKFVNNGAVRVSARISLVEAHEYFDVPPGIKNYSSSIEYVEAKDSVLRSLIRKINNMFRAAVRAREELHQ